MSDSSYRGMPKQEKLALGYCPTCLKHKPKEGYKTCDHCLSYRKSFYTEHGKKQRKEAKEKRLALLRANICPECLNEELMFPYMRCKTCLESLRKGMRSKKLHMTSSFKHPKKDGWRIAKLLDGTYVEYPLIEGKKWGDTTKRIPAEKDDYDQARRAYKKDIAQRNKNIWA